MINKTHSFFICILIFATGTFCQNICFKSCLGIDKLTAFPSTLSIGGKEYNAIDKYAAGMCYSFSFYLTKFEIIDIGIGYSSFSVNLKKDNFPDNLKLSGQATVIKIGPSLLFGKILKSKYHTYFVLEPSYYHTEDKTSITNAPSSGGCEYVGNLIFGIGFGMGFDYYINKYIGISSSTRYDIGRPFDASNFFLSYPSIQIGIILSK
jgi:hypothetical protein